MRLETESTPAWDEQDRLKVLGAYEILDTPREEDFDDLVKIAAQVCRAPISLISFVAADRQWFKAAVGTGLEETPLDVSICSHAIRQEGLFVVPDTTKDFRTANNALVTGDPHIRFYAGAPLQSSEGLPLGTICILDYKPRVLTEEEAFTLNALARQVVTQLELRRALKAKNESEESLTLALSRQQKAVEEMAEANAKFKGVFDQSALFSGIMALDGTVLEANKLCLEGCGYLAQDVIGRPFWDCGWWRGSSEVQDKIQEGTTRAAQGTPFLATLPFTLADGQERLVEFALHPIRNEAGEVIFLHPTGMDVTEQRRAQSRSDFLAQLTQKLSIVIDAAEINRIATCEIGRFLHVSRCYFFQELPEVDQVVVLPDWRQYGEVPLEGNYSLLKFGRPEWRDALRHGTLSVDDVRLHPWTRDFSGAYHGVNVRAYTFAPFMQEGRWVACIGVGSSQPRNWSEDEKSLLENAVARVWPLIERARVQGILHEAKDALHEANAMLGNRASFLESIVQQRTQKLSETIAELEAFSYSISHDMRAPLRSMIGFSEVLKEDYSSSLDEEALTYLNRISNASRRMDRLIQDVLNFSKISREEVAMESVDADALIRDIIHSYPNLHSPVVDIVIRGSLPAIKGNEALLTQCFSNLLENGSKFTAPGSKPGIEVWAENSQERARLFFKDNGIGMAEHSLERIFDIFQRVGRDNDGTGIGLAIVRRAAEKMGGTVGVTSQPAKGSLFWLDLPVA